MKSKIIFLSLLSATAFGAAHAGTIQVGGQNGGAAGMVTAQPNVCTVTFDSGNANNTCGAVYTQGGSPAAASHFRTGSQSGQYAAPAGDTTGFLTVGPTDGAQVTITLGTPANYFGFYAGSLDSFNLVQFFLNGVMVDAFTGTQINAVAFPGSATTGDQSAAKYIDYFTTSLYNSIVYSSTADAFETDSHAFGIAAPRAVPEPGSIALLGIGVLALGARRRKTKV